MEIILRILHGVMDLAHNTVVNNTFDQESLTGLYHVLDLGLKWFKTEELEAWFDKFWVDRRANELTLHDLKVLLYPSYVFRHPEAFARVTKALVFEWNSGEIHGLDPITDFAEYRIQDGVLKGLARVKTRVLDQVTNDLLDPLDSLCDGSCQANGRCIQVYRSALRDCLVFPSSVRRSHSIIQILDSEGLESWECNSPPHASNNCSDILSGGHITAIKIDALSFWDGLCIDCILRTSVGHIEQGKYWKDGQGKRYGETCRLAHDYQTWIYSYMGPLELMSKHLAEQKDREEATARVSTGVLADQPRETAMDPDAEGDYDPEWDLYD
ncbi:hypothetical protein EAF04_002410 [Stromatinia cepivora]|nr:hypothetical protein EAF04_002410 [Stromatinia cepivora]